MNQELKVLLTGFGAFPGMPLNPCVEIVEIMQVWGEQQTFQLQTKLLDVTYHGAYLSVQRWVEEFAPDIVVHLGVSSRIQAVQLENSAVNCRNASIPDAEGQLCSNEFIDSTQSIDARISTELNLNDLKRVLDTIGHEVQISHDAGQYVCNSIYWHSLTHLPIPVLFVHIPNTSTEEHHSTVACVQELVKLLVQAGTQLQV